MEELSTCVNSSTFNSKLFTPSSDNRRSSALKISLPLLPKRGLATQIEYRDPLRFPDQYFQTVPPLLNPNIVCGPLTALEQLHSQA